MPDNQLHLAQWLPYKEDRNAGLGGRSFYFFDLDDNILNMDTRIYLFHKEDNRQIEINSTILAEHSRTIGVSGPYRDYYVDNDDETGSYRNFRDHRIPLRRWIRGDRQAIIHDLREAIAKPVWDWHGPSWNHFFYAVLNGRPLSIITARGHRPDTIRSALNLLYREGHLLKKPNFLSLFPVSNPRLRAEMGDPEKKLSVAALKKIALRQSVEMAFRKYGANPHHRFGVSDDDPRNIEEITGTLVEIKRLYPRNAFFVIDSSGGKIKKTEIFEDNLVESDGIDLADALNYQLFDF